MTAVGVERANEVPAAPTPYMPGPVSDFFGWIERPPAARPWISLVAVTSLFAVGAHVVLWVTGVLAPGTLDVSVIVLVLYLPFPLVGGIVGRRILRSSLATFWPATGWPETDHPAWR